jgi:hypothetical protein
MMNDIALTRSLRHCGGVDSALVAIGTELLGLATADRDWTNSAGC